MTLFDATPPPISFSKSRTLRSDGPGRMVIVAACYVAFHNYREEQTISRFFTTLEKGDYRQAYRLWQPSETYSYDIFLH